MLRRFLDPGVSDLGGGTGYQELRLSNTAKNDSDKTVLVARFLSFARSNFLDFRCAASIMRQSSVKWLNFGFALQGAGGGVYERAGAM